MIRSHRLKCWPGPFDDVRRGLKTFEFRRDDRGFAVGDELVLCEYLPSLDQLTGDEIHAAVRYILRDRFGVPPGHCVMSIRVERFVSGVPGACERACTCAGGGR